MPPADPTPIDSDPWIELFTGKDLTGWLVESGDTENWKVKDGAIVTSGPLSTALKDQTCLLSKKSYTDFIARFEFMAEKGIVNSGFAIRAVPGERTSANPIRPAHVQVMILPAEAGPRGKATGGGHTGDLIVNLDLVIHLPSNSIGQKPAGQWNQMEVELRGQLIQVRLNGETTFRRNLDNAIKKGGTLPGLTRTAGRIGFRRFWGTTRYRNIQIKELAPPAEEGFVPLFNGAVLKCDRPLAVVRHVAATLLARQSPRGDPRPGSPAAVFATRHRHRPTAANGSPRGIAADADLPEEP